MPLRCFRLTVWLTTEGSSTLVLTKASLRLLMPHCLKFIGGTRQDPQLLDPFTMRRTVIFGSNSMMRLNWPITMGKPGERQLCPNQHMDILRASMPRKATGGSLAQIQFIIREAVAVGPGKVRNGENWNIRPLRAIHNRQ